MVALERQQQQQQLQHGNGRGGEQWDWQQPGYHHHQQQQQQWLQPQQQQGQLHLQDAGSHSKGGKNGGKGGMGGWGSGRPSGWTPNVKDLGSLWERTNDAKGFRWIPLDRPCPFSWHGNCFLFQQSGTCSRVHAGNETITGLNYKAEWDL